MRPDTTITAEQSVLGALLIDNDAIDRIADLTADHFYNHEHKLIFLEICKQISSGSRCDVISLYEVLSAKISDCLPYLNSMQQSIGSAANIERYAQIVTDKAIKRALVAIGEEMKGVVASHENSASIVDLMASKIEALAQKKIKQEPKRLSEMLGNYVDVIQDRLDGKIKPIQTGFIDLDKRLSGGLERGTLTVVAGRPGMGKTAFALGIARNVSEWGSALFLSMEMPKDQLLDRSIAALGKLPVTWLREPSDKGDEGKRMFDNMTHAFQRANDMNLYIDDQTALNMLDIRSKCRLVKRKYGLDLIAIDQLSFITGSTQERPWDAVGEYTRGLLSLAKELNTAIVLLCQLNRQCEARQNKRPMLSDLASSGSIEQDAANVVFLYRDEIYNPDSPDIGICEIITAKQRQGSTGIVGLTYIGEQTRFENLSRNWSPELREAKPSRKGFD